MLLKQSAVKLRPPKLFNLAIPLKECKTVAIVHAKLNNLKDGNKWHGS